MQQSSTSGRRGATGSVSLGLRPKPLRSQTIGAAVSVPVESTSASRLAPSTDAATVHALSPAAACALFEVTPALGLSAPEVLRRRDRAGPNELPAPPKRHPVVRFLAQLANPLVGALLVAAVIAAWIAAVGAGTATEGLGRYGDTAAILLIVALNACLGYVQEQRAERALDALRAMTAPAARVRRDGELVVVAARELVPGDVIELEAGDAVPADARLLEASELSVEEAALTGESEAVEKQPAAVAPDAPLAEQRSCLFLGTHVARGHGLALVVRTGAATELGKIDLLLRRAPAPPTPLEQQLARLGRGVLAICVGFSLLLFALGVVRGAESWPVLLLTAVSLAVAAIPEGLPAITTITLALGMQRMARRGALIRRLPAVETLGSATVICTDKTGTLTENAMTVRRVETLERAYAVTGAGREARGAVEPRDGGGPAQQDRVLAALLRALTLCNTAEVAERGGREDARLLEVRGDATETALLVCAWKAGVRRSALLATASLERVLPFDSLRMLMTVITAEGPLRSADVKGSPEAVLARCTRAALAEGVVPLSGPERERILARVAALADEGLRVLAAAHADAPGDDPERDLTFLGLVAMEDPPRADALPALRACREAGVRVVMITGDHPRTALSIARQLELLDATDAPAHAAMTGSELGALSDDALRERVSAVTVFSRVTAAQKLRIVTALQARGEVVAMTGDGVNDAPALRQAQLGVAMGRQGTDVAREASAMVLSDDSFSTIVEALREGRAIYANLQKSVFFLNSSNAGLVFAVVAGSFFSWLPALTPLQLLWINLVTNGLPALALGLDPADPRQMHERPRAFRASVFGARELTGAVFVGVLLGAAALSLFWLPASWPALFEAAADRPAALERARTMAFLVLALGPLVHAFNARSPLDSIWTLGWSSNRFLLLAVAVSASAELLVVGVPALRPLFMATPLSPAEWIVVLALSLVPLPAVELAKLVARALVSRRKVAPPSAMPPS